MKPIPEWTGPLFLVGPSRSGTAMLRSVLNQHADTFLAGETHYFDDLRERFPNSRVTIGNSEQYRIADYFRALDDRPYGMHGNPDNSPMERSDIIRRAMDIGGRPDDFFESYCRLTAERAGKSIWGEKTPRHVFRLADIFGSFPQARVICMVRDPRSVVASYRHWRNQGGLNAEGDEEYRQAILREEARARRSYNIIIATMLWRGAVNAALGARTRFGHNRVLVQRYEDIVEAPEEAISGICNWLGLHYDPSMLSIPMHNSSFTPFAEASGVSREPLDRWRTTLSAREISIVEKAAGSCLVDAGYATQGAGVNYAVYALEWLKVVPAAVRAASVNRERIGSLPSYVWRRLSTAWRS